jgi:hypothetical protein
MYRIVLNAQGGPRLMAGAILTSANFEAISGERPGSVFAARKSGLVAVRVAAHDEAIETRWNGKETKNTARAGDFIVTNLDATGAPLIDRDGNRNVYVIFASTFPKLYEDAARDTPLGPAYRARGTVDAIAFTGGFEIVAPWGEKQVAANGYLIRNGADVYGNNAETFEATYARAS